MSFSSLRQGSPIYILNKEGVPTIEIGTIVSVSAPVPKFGQLPQFGTPQAMTVDLTIKVGDKTGPFPKVNAHADVEEYEHNGVKTSYVLATTKEAMNAEIQSLDRKADEIISSVAYWQQVKGACGDMYRKLNPEYAEKQRQEQEISELKAQMAAQQAQMSELISLLKGQSKEEKPTKTK